MGNCLNVNNSDDISLLRDGAFSQDINADAQSTVPSYFSDAATSSIYQASHSSRPLKQTPEDVKLSKRLCLIQHLPVGNFHDAQKSRECVICMLDFCIGESVRYLPCMHAYHVQCIDDWLMRSLTCPCCLEPVDAALLTSYEST